MRRNLPLVATAALLALSGCAEGDATGSELFSVLPIVFADGPDSQDSFGELVQDSDIVVVGRVTGVSVDPLDIFSPAAEFATGRYKISITVTPSSGARAVTYGTVLEVAPELAKSTIREIVDASLPAAEMLFALREIDGWGYACTSGDPGLCPIEMTPVGLRSPRLEEYVPFRGVGDMGGLGAAEYVQSLDPTVEVR